MIINISQQNSIFLIVHHRSKTRLAWNRRKMPQWTKCALISKENQHKYSRNANIMWIVRHFRRAPILFCLCMQQFNWMMTQESYVTPPRNTDRKISANMERACIPPDLYHKNNDSNKYNALPSAGRDVKKYNICLLWKWWRTQYTCVYTIHHT